MNNKDFTLLFIALLFTIYYAVSTRLFIDLVVEVFILAIKFIAINVNDSDTNVPAHIPSAPNTLDSTNKDIGKNITDLNKHIKVDNFGISIAW